MDNPLLMLAVLLTLGVILVNGWTDAGLDHGFVFCHHGRGCCKTPVCHRFRCGKGDGYGLDSVSPGMRTDRIYYDKDFYQYFLTDGGIYHGEQSRSFLF